MGKAEQEMLNQLINSIQKINSELDVISVTESVLSSSSSQLTNIEKIVSKLEENQREYTSKFTELLRSINGEHEFLEIQANKISQSRSDIFNVYEQLGVSSLTAYLQQIIDLFEKRFDAIRNHEVAIQRTLEQLNAFTKIAEGMREKTRQFSALFTDISGCVSKFQQLAEGISKKIGEMSEVQEKINAKYEQLVMWERSLNDREENLLKLKHECERLLEINKDLDRQIHEKQETLQNLERELLIRRENLKKQLSQEGKKLTQAQIEAAEVKQRTADRFRRLMEMKEQLYVLKSEYEMKMNALNQRAENIRVREQSLENIFSRIKTLEEENRDLRKQVIHLTLRSSPQ
ncbi:MAG: hypothetical protein QXR19_14370 [Candidatus Jordarchaeaceae archaeon]